MQRTKQIVWGFGLLGALLLASAALATVTTDYDHKADFSKYKTFSWIKEPVTKDPLMKDRIIGFINEQLQKKEFSLAKTGGDLSIAAHAATQERRTLETFYNGFGGWRWSGGLGGATTMVETYEVGTLVVDIFDSHTKQVVWRGVASDTLSDKAEKNTEKAQKAIAQLFKDFPPKFKATGK